MHLMVYAPYGRSGVHMLQEFCKRIGIRATYSGVRDLIVALKALPAGHPLKRLLREFPDSVPRPHSPLHYCVRRTAHTPCRRFLTASTQAA